MTEQEAVEMGAAIASKATSLIFEARLHQSADLNALVCQAERDVEKLQSALDSAWQKRRSMAARISQLCALMQSDIDSGKVTLTSTRKMVLEESRRLAIHERV